MGIATLSEGHDMASWSIFWDVAALARKHGINVRAGTLPGDERGYYYDPERLVVVSDKLDPYSRLWCLFHELGHAVRHRGKLDYARYQADRRYWADVEEEADRFARLLGRIGRARQREAHARAKA